MYVPFRLLRASNLSAGLRLLREKYCEYRVLPVRCKLRFSRQSTDICHLRGKSISERRNEFTVRGVPERTLSCRFCVSERYGAARANRRHDGTDILFRSFIHRRLLRHRISLRKRRRENLKIAHFPSRTPLPP